MTPTLTAPTRRKGKPFSRIQRRDLTLLPNGHIAYLHPTKGLRNRYPTIQLMTGLLGTAAA